MSEADYRALVDWIGRHGKRPKRNTVISEYNVDEDFNAFIRDLRPKRWRLFQTLPVQGQNQNYFCFPVSAISAA